MKKMFGQPAKGFSRRTLLLAAPALALCGISLILGALRRDLVQRQDQQAAARWAGDGSRCAQVSLFLDADNAFSPQRVQGIGVSMDDRLREESYRAAEGGRLWTYAAGCEEEGDASTDQGSCSVHVTAVQGDYFLFHPQQLLSGSTFLSSDVNHDTVVLDELAAWQLFGSPDVTGRTVTVNGRCFVVCGVVAAPEDAAAVLTWGDKARVWVFFDALHEDSDPRLTFYEAVLPDAYTGYAQKQLQEVTGVPETGCLTVENSARYRPASLWKTLRQMERAGLHSDAVQLPWHENAARLVQNRAARLWGAQMVCLLYPVLLLLVWAVIAWRHRTWHLTDLKKAWDARVQRRLQAAWDAAEHPDAFGDNFGENETQQE